MDLEKFVEGRLFNWVGPIICSAAVIPLALLIIWADGVLSALSGALAPLAALLSSFVGGVLGDWANTPPWAFLILALLYEIHRRMR